MPRSEGIIVQPKLIRDIKNITIGKNCNIGFGTVIGKDGFGFDEIDGKLIRNEHKFGVVIGDDVEIGANCNIDRGRWRDTVINNGTKIDSLVHIGHNVKVGENCIIGPHVTLGGSCEIGFKISVKGY